MIFKSNIFFSWINASMFLLNLGGPLSSHTTNSSGMKLLRIFRIVFLKTSTFLLTLKLKKALCQLNSLITCLMSSILASIYICQASKGGGYIISKTKSV